MSGCYVVLVTNDQAEVEVCETYAGVQSALGRAVHLAAKITSNITLVDTSPAEEKLDDGSVRWVFLDSNHHFVGVYFKTIQVVLNSRNERLDAVRTVPVVPQISATVQGILNHLPPDDPYAPELPGGWNVDGEPIRMRHYKDSAEDIKNPVSELTEDEQWALATARVRKRPAFHTQIGPDGYYHWSALQELNTRSPVGLHIRDKEMQLLGVYRENWIDSYYR